MSEINISRRGTFKLFAGALLTSMVGVGGTLPVPTNNVITKAGTSIMTRPDLMSLFGVFPSDPSHSSALIYNLNYVPRKTSGNIPEIELQFEKLAVDTTKRETSDCMRAVDVFVEEAVKDLPIYDTGKTDQYTSLIHASAKIAVESRRGAGNIIFTHPETNIKKYDFARWRFFTSEKVPKGQALIIYAGQEYYDKPVSLSIDGVLQLGEDNVARARDEQLETILDKSKEWMVCHRPDFDKYAKLIKI